MSKYIEELEVYSGSAKLPIQNTERICKINTKYLNLNIMEKIHNVSIDHSDETALLNCKSCKRKISITAITCPQCGDRDPFFFDQIAKKIGFTSSYWGIYKSLLVFFSLWVWYASSKWWIALIVFVVLSAIGYLVYNLYGLSKIEEFCRNIDSKMQTILSDESYRIWSKYSSRILNEHNVNN